MLNLYSYIKNILFKFYISLIEILPKYSSSQKYWNNNIVDNPRFGFKSEIDSLNHLNWRNSQYIKFLKKVNMTNLSDKVVLDFGCGPGNDVINACTLSKPKKMIAYDVSRTAIELAKKRANLHKINVEFILGDEKNKNIPLKSNSIDVINSMGVLHHIDRIEVTLKELKRIIKNNGYIQVMVYNKNSIWFHLHVAYEVKLKKKLWENESLDEIFRKTTDGLRCPISNCYTEREFISLCKKNGFNSTLTGVSTSLFEMTKINLLWEALRNKELNDHSRKFLENINFDKNGEPLHNGNIAGINSYYKLDPI